MIENITEAQSALSKAFAGLINLSDDALREASKLGLSIGVSANLASLLREQHGDRAELFLGRCCVTEHKADRDRRAHYLRFVVAIAVAVVSAAIGWNWSDHGGVLAVLGTAGLGICGGAVAIALTE